MLPIQRARNKRAPTSSTYAGDTFKLARADWTKHQHRGDRSTALQDLLRTVSEHLAISADCRPRSRVVRTGGRVRRQRQRVRRHRIGIEITDIKLFHFGHTFLDHSTRGSESIIAQSARSIRRRNVLIFPVSCQWNFKSKSRGTPCSAGKNYAHSYRYWSSY